jgi:hypothetical protein
MLDDASARVMDAEYEIEFDAGCARLLASVATGLNAAERALSWARNAGLAPPCSTSELAALFDHENSTTRICSLKTRSSSFSPAWVCGKQAPEQDHQHPRRSRHERSLDRVPAWGAEDDPEGCPGHPGRQVGWPTNGSTTEDVARSVRASLKSR